MTLPSTSVLDGLERRAQDIVALARAFDADSQATLSAKRRFFLIEMEVAGLHPDQVTAQQEADVRALGCSSLAALLHGFHRLNEYSSSPERLEWNPGAQPGRNNVPVSFDWFIASDVPQDWNWKDFLSRCERIWRDQEVAGEGLLFTRIFNHRVKFVTGYEDGLRLVISRVEVGEFVAPPMTTPLITVEPIDLVRRMDAYSGDPDDWNALVQVPMGLPHWAFSLAEIDRQPFSALKNILGEANFDKIVAQQGYVRPKTEFQTYVGEDGLPLHYYTREGDRPDTRELILVSFGEYQPQRWLAHIEGFWRVSGINF
jgi:hypothetical protein